MQEVTVFVLPVKRVSVQGRGNYTISLPDGTKVPAERTFHRDVQKTFAFASNKEGTKLITGLEKLIDNPYYQQELDDLPEEIRPKGDWAIKYEELLKPRQQITLQTFYEVLDNVPLGTYTSEKSKITMVNSFGFNSMFKEWTPTYLENFRIYLKDGTNVFTNKTSRGRLAIQLLRNHPRIAKSSSEVNINVHDFYIATEEESYINKRDSRKLVSKGAVALEKLATASEEDPFLLQMVAGAVGILKGVNTSRYKILDMLDNYIWEEKNINREKQEDRIRKFIDIVSLIDTKEGRDKIYVKYLITMALQTNTFAISNGSIFWLSKRDSNLFELGRDMQKIETGFLNDISKKESGLEAPIIDLEEELKRKNIEVNLR